MSVGKKLKYYRTINNLTQSQISSIIGVSRRQYIKYEQEIVEPKIKTLEKLSNAFNISITDLL